MSFKTPVKKTGGVHFCLEGFSLKLILNYGSGFLKNCCAKEVEEVYCPYFKMQTFFH